MGVIKVLKPISLAIPLLLLINGCGLSLEVQKRVHRPGFYVNVSHEKEHVKVNKGKKSVGNQDRERQASLQKVKPSTYKDFEVEITEPRLGKAPLVDLTDSTFSVAQMDKKDSGNGISEKKEQRFLMLNKSLENLRSMPREAQASHTMGVGGRPTTLFSFHFEDFLVEIAVGVVVYYIVSNYLAGVFLLMFASPALGLALLLVAVVFILLLHVILSGGSNAYY